MNIYIFEKKSNLYFLKSKSVLIEWKFLRDPILIVSNKYEKSSIGYQLVGLKCKTHVTKPSIIYI